jgi:hypothetical protein
LFCWDAATQVDPLQQPAQVLELHPAEPVQAPFTQASVPEQEPQRVPPVPQAAAVCCESGTQTEPLQQPEQVEASQAVAAQAPDWQVVPAEHPWHASPFCPQEKSAVPSWHLPLLSQQPWQFSGPQGAGELEHAARPPHTTARTTRPRFFIGFSLASSYTPAPFFP